MSTKPASIDLSHLRTRESRNRQIPRLKGLYEYMNRPGTITLAGGTPNSSIFPFDGVGTSSLEPPFSRGILAPKLGKRGTIGFRVFEHTSEDPQQGVSDIQLATSLQYGAASGNPQLREFMKTHTGLIHDVGFSDWDVMLSVGNTYGWDTVLRTFCEPTDTIFYEEFTFSSAMENAQGRGCVGIGIAVDDLGLIPSDLRIKAAQHRPKLLYTIPTGQNPTGSVLATKRRREIVQIANEFDFIIVEDEPYYYLQMNAVKDLSGSIEEKRAKFLASLAPSMLEFDTQGRVLRLDSFSKIMAPGIRMGWITGQTKLIEAIRQIAESSSSQPSGFAQSLVYGVLARWGQNGLIDWLIGLCDEYTDRRDLCCSVLRRDLVKIDTPIELVIPDAGMFFWLKIRVPDNLLATYTAKSVEEDLFYRMANEFHVLLVPGHWCKVNDDSDDEKFIFFRGTFASAEKKEITEGAERLVAALHDYLDSHPTEPYTVVEMDDICK